MARWSVSLAPLIDPNLVILAIIQTLGLREAQDQSLDQLKALVREKQVLYCWTTLSR